MEFSSCHLVVFSLFIILIYNFVKLVKEKFFSKTCSSKVCLVGKTALVTGGSQGIGYEIVLALAQRGCKVVIADKIISNDIKNKIIEETKNPEIYMEFVDLGSFCSVRALGEKLKKREKKLDILIHNAAIGHCEEALSEDDLNLTMQVNYYSPFLLTHLLIGLLKRSSSARIIFSCSPIVSGLLNYLFFGKQMQNIFGDYRVSKFCLLVITDIFAEKLKSFNITSNAFHPGVVNTQLHAQFFKTGILKFIHLLSPIFFKTPESGAQTAIFLSCANEVENVTGRFFENLEPMCKPKPLQNKKLCENIWEISEKAVKLRKDELL